MFQRYRLRTAGALCAVAFASLPALAQLNMDTRFTYQGRLSEGGQPANGVYDIRVRLFVDAEGTLQTGPDVVAEGVAVHDGLFTTKLDFGAQFTGYRNWAEIAVRPGVSTGDFTPLTPLQEITATPVAQFAMAPFYTVPGTYDLAYTQGSVGIGREPGSIVGYPFGLDVSAQAIRLGLDGNGGGQLVFVNNPGDNNIFLEAYGSGGVGSANQMYLTGAQGGQIPKLTLKGDTTEFTGNVGIGSPSPTARLDARGGGTGTGVYGRTDTGYGVYGYTTSASVGTAVYADGAQYGVYAKSYQGTGAAVWAVNDSGNAVVGVSAAPGYGSVIGASSAPTGYGGFFYNSGGGVALRADGLFETKTLRILGGADVAEAFEVRGAASGTPAAPTTGAAADAAAAVAPGMVVVIDPAHPGALRVAADAYDTKVAGIVSGANGLASGMVLKAEGTPMADGEHAIAMSGRVWCWVDADRGAVQPGDLLTTSPTPGHAMRAADSTRAHGAVLGKAMTPLTRGRGLVLVLVNLQ